MPTVETLPTAEIAAGAGGAPLELSLSPATSNTVRTLDGEDDDYYDEDIDETLAERLLGLTEMFPTSVRNVTSGVVSMSMSASRWLYSASRSGLWVVASSATILALPVMFETERSQMEEQQLAQQRQILLGPNAAVSGTTGAMGLGITPPGR